jgi:WD40 repeat protein
MTELSLDSAKILKLNEILIGVLDYATVDKISELPRVLDRAIVGVRTTLPTENERVVTDYYMRQHVVNHLKTIRDDEEQKDDSDEMREFRETTIDYVIDMISVDMTEPTKTPSESLFESVNIGFDNDPYLKIEYAVNTMSRDIVGIADLMKNEIQETVVNFVTKYKTYFKTMESKRGYLAPKTYIESSYILGDVYETLGLYYKLQSEILMQLMTTDEESWINSIQEILLEIETAQTKILTLLFHPLIYNDLLPSAIKTALEIPNKDGGGPRSLMSQYDVIVTDRQRNKYVLVYDNLYTSMVQYMIETMSSNVSQNAYIFSALREFLYDRTSVIVFKTIMRRRFMQFNEKNTVYTQDKTRSIIDYYKDINGLDAFVGQFEMSTDVFETYQTRNKVHDKRLIPGYYNYRALRKRISEQGQETVLQSIYDRIKTGDLDTSVILREYREIDRITDTKEYVYGLVLVVTSKIVYSLYTSGHLVRIIRSMIAMDPNHRDHAIAQLFLTYVNKLDQITLKNTGGYKRVEKEVERMNEILEIVRDLPEFKKKMKETKKDGFIGDIRGWVNDRHFSKKSYTRCEHVAMSDRMTKTSNRLEQMKLSDAKEDDVDKVALKLKMDKIMYNEMTRGGVCSLCGVTVVSQEIVGDQSGYTYKERVAIFEFVNKINNDGTKELIETHNKIMGNLELVQAKTQTFINTITFKKQNTTESEHVTYNMEDFHTYSPLLDYPDPNMSYATKQSLKSIMYVVIENFNRYMYGHVSALDRKIVTSDGSKKIPKMMNVYFEMLTYMKLIRFIHDKLISEDASNVDGVDMYVGDDVIASEKWFTYDTIRTIHLYLNREVGSKHKFLENTSVVSKNEHSIFNMYINMYNQFVKYEDRESLVFRYKTQKTVGSNYSATEIDHVTKSVGYPDVIQSVPVEYKTNDESAEFLAEQAERMIRMKKTLYDTFGILHDQDNNQEYIDLLMKKIATLDEEEAEAIPNDNQSVLRRNQRVDLEKELEVVTTKDETRATVLDALFLVIRGEYIKTDINLYDDYKSEMLRDNHTKLQKIMYKSTEWNVSDEKDITQNFTAMFEHIITCKRLSSDPDHPYFNDHSRVMDELKTLLEDDEIYSFVPMEEFLYGTHNDVYKILVRHLATLREQMYKVYSFKNGVMDRIREIVHEKGPHLDQDRDGAFSYQLKGPGTFRRDKYLNLASEGKTQLSWYVSSMFLKYQSLAKDFFNIHLVFDSTMSGDRTDPKFKEMFEDVLRPAFTKVMAIDQDGVRAQYSTLRKFRNMDLFQYFNKLPENASNVGDVFDEYNDLMRYSDYDASLMVHSMTDVDVRAELKLAKYSFKNKYTNAIITNLSIDDNHIVTGYNNHNIALWKSDGTLLNNNITGHHDRAIKAVRVSQGKIISVDESGSIVYWDMDGSYIQKISNHYGVVLSVQITDDRIFIVTMKSTMVYDIDTSRRLGIQLFQKTSGQTMSTHVLNNEVVVYGFENHKHTWWNTVTNKLYVFKESFKEFAVSSTHFAFEVSDGVVIVPLENMEFELGKITIRRDNSHVVPFTKVSSMVFGDDILYISGTDGYIHTYHQPTRQLSTYLAVQAKVDMSNVTKFGDHEYGVRKSFLHSDRETSVPATKKSTVTVDDRTTATHLRVHDGQLIYATPRDNSPYRSRGRDRVQKLHVTSNDMKRHGPERDVEFNERELVTGTFIHGERLYVRTNNSPPNHTMKDVRSFVKNVYKYFEVTKTQLVKRPEPLTRITTKVMNDWSHVPVKYHWQKSRFGDGGYTTSVKVINLIEKVNQFCQFNMIEGADTMAAVYEYDSESPTDIGKDMIFDMYFKHNKVFLYSVFGIGNRQMPKYDTRVFDQEITQSHTREIPNLFLIKAGIGETPRQLLEKYPSRIVLKNDVYSFLDHDKNIKHGEDLEKIKKMYVYSKLHAQGTIKLLDDLHSVYVFPTYEKLLDYSLKYDLLHEDDVEIIFGFSDTGVDVKRMYHNHIKSCIKSQKNELSEQDKQQLTATVLDDVTGIPERDLVEEMTDLERIPPLKRSTTQRGRLADLKRKYNRFIQGKRMSKIFSFDIDSLRVNTGVIKNVDESNDLFTLKSHMFQFMHGRIVKNTFDRMNSDAVNQLASSYVESPSRNVTVADRFQQLFPGKDPSTFTKMFDYDPDIIGSEHDRWMNNVENGSYIKASDVPSFLLDMYRQDDAKTEKITMELKDISNKRVPEQNAMHIALFKSYVPLYDYYDVMKRNRFLTMPTVDQVDQIQYKVMRNDVIFIKRIHTTQDMKRRIIQLSEFLDSVDRFKNLTEKDNYNLFLTNPEIIRSYERNIRAQLNKLVHKSNKPSGTEEEQKIQKDANVKTVSETMTKVGYTFDKAKIAKYIKNHDAELGKGSSTVTKALSKMMKVEEDEIVDEIVEDAFNVEDDRDQRAVRQDNDEEEIDFGAEDE